MYTGSPWLKKGECNTKVEKSVDAIYLAFSKTNDSSTHYFDLKIKSFTNITKLIFKKPLFNIKC